jgi:hypothetical protein
MRGIATVLGVAGALMLTTWASHAEVFCQQAGSQTYCSNGQVFEQFGNMTYDHRGNAWQQLGNQAYGSNGTVYEQHGPQTFVSRGGSVQQFDNQSRTGAPCKLIGGLAVCQ